MTPELILTAGLLFVCYAAVANRLFAFARVLRNETVDTARAIVMDERVPDLHRRRAVSAALGVADARAAWRAVFFLLPAIYEVAYAAFRKRLGHDLSHGQETEGKMPSDLSEKHARLVRVSIMAPLCASPAALMAFALVISCASFAVSGLALAELVLAKMGSKDPDDSGDFCPPAAHA